MSEQINPGQSEERNAPESGLFLSAESLEGSAPLKAASDADSSDAGSDKDMGGSGDADSSDASEDKDTGGSGDADSGDESDADGTDVEDADGTDTGADADGTDPLGIASDGKDAG